MQKSIMKIDLKNQNINEKNKQILKTAFENAEITNRYSKQEIRKKLEKKSK